MRRRARSPRPSYGSWSIRRLGEYAMALIVRSRRARSSSREAPNSDDRVAAIRADVMSKRRDLMQHAAAIEYADGAVGHPTGTVRLEQPHHVFGTRCSGQIPIGMAETQERVANRAANAPGLEALAFEPFGDPEDGNGWPECRSPLETVTTTSVAASAAFRLHATPRTARPRRSHSTGRQDQH